MKDRRRNQNTRIALLLCLLLFECGNATKDERRPNERRDHPEADSAAMALEHYCNLRRISLSVSVLCRTPLVPGLQSVRLHVEELSLIRFDRVSVKYM